LTFVNTLTDEGRIAELAEMLGTPENGRSRDSANDIVAHARKVKAE